MMCWSLWMRWHACKMVSHKFVHRCEYSSSFFWILFTCFTVSCTHTHCSMQCCFSAVKAMHRKMASETYKSVQCLNNKHRARWFEWQFFQWTFVCTKWTIKQAHTHSLTHAQRRTQREGTKCIHCTALHCTEMHAPFTCAQQKLHIMRWQWSHSTFTCNLSTFKVLACSFFFFSRTNEFNRNEHKAKMRKRGSEWLKIATTPNEKIKKKRRTMKVKAKSTHIHVSLSATICLFMQLSHFYRSHVQCAMHTRIVCMCVCVWALNGILSIFGIGAHLEFSFFDFLAIIVASAAVAATTVVNYFIFLK